MADPFTLSTVKVMADLAREVRIANGFYTDAGADVSTELKELTTESSAPRIFALEGDFVRTGKSQTGISGDQTIVYEGYIPARKADAEEIAHQLRADLLRVVCRVPASAFAAIPSALGIVSKYDIGEDCAIKRRVDGVEFVVVQVSTKLSCALYF